MITYISNYVDEILYSRTSIIQHSIKQYLGADYKALSFEFFFATKVVIWPQTSKTTGK